MRFTEIISESSGTKLKDIAKIATNMQDADFWLVRKGSDKTVGKPVKEFDPSRIGVKVVRTDVLDPNYLYYAMMNLHNQGHFARLANGTTNLVNITVNDIANIPLGQQDVAEGTEQQLVTIYTNPAYKGATVDDRIKKSLPVTEAPFNKLQMWENSKSMKDPKVAQWVNNNLLPQLKLNGKLGPLVVWNNKGKLFVIDGNHRFIAYQAAGYNGNVPVQIVPDKMINIVDTVPGQQGVAEASSPAQQAAIAINMKKNHQKPKNEGEVIPMQPRNLLNKNLIIQLKALSETALELFWEGSHVPTAAQGQMAELSQQEQTKIFNQNVAQFKALGYETSIFEDDMDILFLHSIAREAWYDSKKPMSKYRGLPDLEYNSDTNSLKIIDLIGDDDEGIVYDKNIYEQGIEEGENWSKHNNKRVGGMSKKSVSSYRRSHPGSKIQTAVTTKPSKLKKGSKAAKRRKSFCARMKGMKKSRTSAKTARDPNSNINKSLRRWNCESIEQMEELLMLAEQMVAKARKEIL